MDSTKNVGTATIVAQKVAGISFISNDLVKNSAGTSATFTYKVVDQYGADITKTTSASDISATAIVGSSSIVPVLNPATGTGTITKTYADTDKTAVVTLVHKTTGTTATTTLNVAAAASVQDLTFGTNILPTGKTNIENGLSTAVTIPVTAKDQYGNTITNLSELNSALNIVSSNTGASFYLQSDADNNAQLVMDTTGMTDKGTVVLTIVNKTTGKSWSQTINVVKASAAYSITLGDFSKDTIASGDTKVAIPVTVLDQFGNTLTKDQIATNAATINSWIGGVSGATGFTTLTIDTDKNSSTYGELKSGNVTLATPTTAASGVIIVNAPGGVVTKNFTVNPARVVTTVNKIDNVTLLQGATTDLKFVFDDQYNSALANTDSVNHLSVNDGTYDNGDLTYKVEVTKVSGDDNGVSVTAPASLTGASEASIGKITVASDATKTGTYKVTVSLLDSNSIAVSSASTNITVAKNNVSGLTYSVADVPTLDGSTDHTSALATDAYAQKISVSAKDASGNNYVINKGDIVSVTSSDAFVGAVKDVTSGDWYVGGDASGFAATETTKTATLTITINTLDGLKTIDKTVTVAKATPKVQQLRVVNSAIGGSTQDISDKTDKLVYAFATKDAAVTGTAVNVIGLDQYGVWSDIAAPSVVVNSTDLAPVDAFTYGSGSLKLQASKRAATTAGKDLKITLMKDTGSVQVTANIAAGDVLTAAPSATPDNKFTASETGYASFTLAAATMTDMDPTTAAVDTSITINGLTYTVSGTTTGAVAVTGTATAAADATVKTITVVDSATGASDTLKLNIPAVTASEASTGVTITITK